jgi:hypothetical protein
MATQLSTPNSQSDEIFFSNDGVSLCLIVNRRARSMRIVDFRSGPHPAKRVFVMGLARREGVERVYTLVERDECSTWTRLGFQREGNIPSFYKRSDAFILGALVPAVQDGDSAEQSGMRAAVAAADDHELERIHQAVRKLAKERETASAPQVRVQPGKEPDVKKAQTAALRARRALTGFEPFGRDVVRSSFACTSRGGFSLIASVETQPCFNNAFVELLTGPRTEKEALLTTAAIRQLCEELFEREIVSCFALTATRDLELGTAFVNNGFRRTGVLRSHLLIGGQRLDAFLWSRKLAQPSDG